jgi:hypothetical protein
MSTEYQRLQNLLADHKITANEFKLLTTALANKSSRFMEIFHFLLNPFRKINAVTALMLGVINLLAMSYFATKAKIYLLSAFSFVPESYLHYNKISITFWLSVYQNVVCWILFSIVFLLFAKLFRQKNLRIIDFISYVGLARIPTFLIVLLTYLVQRISPDFFTNKQYYPSILSSCGFIIELTAVVWQLILYFNALKEASGLIAGKLWLTVLLSFIIVTTVAFQLTMLPFY